MDLMPPTDVQANGQTTAMPQTSQSMPCDYPMDARTQLLPPDQNTPQAAGQATQAIRGMSPVVSSSTSTRFVMQAQVAVPSGSAPGQEIHFTADGRRLSATVPEALTPGSILTVQYPIDNNQPPAPSIQPAPLTLQPAHPLPQVVTSVEHQDPQAKNMWKLYGAGWLGCCCHPFIGLIVWLVVASMYYCKPRSNRRNFPRQRGPASASAITITVIALVLALVMSIGLAVYHDCGHELQHCPRIAASIHRMERHINHMEKKMHHRKHHFQDRPNHHFEQESPPHHMSDLLEAQKNGRWGGFLRKADRKYRQPEAFIEKNIKDNTGQSWWSGSKFEEKDKDLIVE